MSEPQVCFVISPIGKADSDIRRRSDLILKHVITPIATSCGYETQRADKISEPGIITRQIINHIMNDAMVVADLTSENANVFYELAVRHASQKPWVQIIQKGERIPFDVAGLRTIEIDHQDLDSVEEAKETIKKHMQAAASGLPMESPISSAIDFERLRHSEDPGKREMAEILQQVSEIKRMVQRRAFRKRLPVNIRSSPLAETIAKQFSDGITPYGVEGLPVNNTTIREILEALKRQQENDKTDEGGL